MSTAELWASSGRDAIAGEYLREREGERERRRDNSLHEHQETVVLWSVATDEVLPGSPEVPRVEDAAKVSDEDEHGGAGAVVGIQHCDRDADPLPRTLHVQQPRLTHFQLHLHRRREVNSFSLFMLKPSPSPTHDEISSDLELPQEQTSGGGCAVDGVAPLGAQP